MGQLNPDDHQSPITLSLLTSTCPLCSAVLSDDQKGTQIGREALNRKRLWGRDTHKKNIYTEYRKHYKEIGEKLYRLMYVLRRRRQQQQQQDNMVLCI